MSGADRVPPSTDTHAPGEPIDFETLAGSKETSWSRADPDAALIESTGRYGYRVTLPDGDAHLVAVAREDGQHVGTCDCEAWEYHDGPCAHLCVVRKAAFAGVEDVEGEPVTNRHVDGNTLYERVGPTHLRLGDEFARPGDASREVELCPSELVGVGVGLAEFLQDTILDHIQASWRVLTLSLST
jgi:hypothetical protein